MKIKIYEKFIEILETNTIQLKFFKISLCRTYLFGNKKELYFRKHLIPRRMELISKEKQFKCKSIDLSKLNLKKNSMRLNNNVLIEYITNPFVDYNDDYNFDIAKKTKNNFKIDSLKNNGVTSMYFKGIDNKRPSNMLWINANN
ncbi:MAG: hypothetical protein IKQ35_03270 [Bacilli bacterium]|nr:hypothetical protein [Bacilli bacterium]